MKHHMGRKFLFVSITGLISDIAWKVKEEGNEVKYYIKDQEEIEVGDGFVEKVDEYEKYVDWADVIVFDDTLGHGKLAQGLREKGHLVVGGTEYTDRLEDDRAFGQDELKKHGINIIPHHDFSSYDEATDYIKKHPGKYVLKPSLGSTGGKGLLYIGEEEDGRDVLQVLSDYQKAWPDKLANIQLQKRVTGVEIAVGAFFNGKEFMTPIHVNFENKRLFPGNLGPSTGEMGTQAFWSSPTKMFTSTLKKFESRLAQEKYVGYIDLNCIVNGHGIYPLEFTARFGYPTISIQQEAMTTPMGEFLYGMASGELTTFKVKSGFHLGVRIVVPPFPFDDPETFAAKSKDSVITFKKGTDGVHIEDVKLVNGEWVVTGTSGVVLIVCGTGATMRDAIKQCYNRISNIKIPHMYYRDDIGERWYEDSDRLHSWGYLRES